jgi:hypothetical protein
VVLSGPFSYTNKTDHHDITKILFKVALNTITLTPQFSTNTRRKTLFIYSMCVEKKNGSLQKMNKTKIEKYRRKNNSNCRPLSLS